MAVLFLVFIGGFFVFHVTHHTVLAYACLAYALLLLHPIRALVLFCLAVVGNAVIGLVNLVLPGRRRRRDPLDVPPPTTRRPVPPTRSPAPSARPAPSPMTPSPMTQPDPAGHHWQGQASPFLDRRGRNRDNKP